MHVRIPSRPVVFFSALTILALTIGLVSAALPQPQARAQTTAPAEDLPLYLPLVRGEFPMVASVFGSEYAPPVSDQIQTLSKEAGNYWLRWTLFDWNMIEATQNVYDWSSVPDAQIQNAVSKGMKIIAIIKNVPEWARYDEKGALVCGPIDPDALDDFAQFTRDVVTRYKGFIHYWELGNEPDVDPGIHGANAEPAYGCWGDDVDPFYGGRHYGNMLSQVYPQIKAADPGAKVLIGGLLMDCDPTHPPSGYNCLATKFFEGILRGANGQGAQYFDIVSFHGYPVYDGNQPVDETLINWAARGGVVVGKVDYLREVMQSFGVSKPIFHTENALLCPENQTFCASPSDDFFEDQADYVVKAYTRSMALGIEANIWYTFNNGGWRFSGMLDESNTPKKAYDAYAFLISQLRKAQYLNEITSYGGVGGYRFSRGANPQMWVLWSQDGTPKNVPLPAGTLRVFDKYGVEQALTPNLSISRPVYLEVSP